MPDLSTKYLGLNLKNPIVVGANNLSADHKKLHKLEEAGAAAVVYKSLFEEQIQLERAQMDEELTEFDERSPEMVTTHPTVEHSGPEEHLHNLEKAREALGIPLIASLNAVYKETWVEYVKKIEETGVDGLELNFYHIPHSFDKEGQSIENQQVDILNEIKKNVSIPVSVKLSPFYTNVLNVIRKIDESGINGFVLFNRFFEPDINVQKEEHRFPFNLSSKGDYKLPLRYAGLLYNNINGDICSSTGIFTGEDVIRMILAGADCTQVVSTIYINKFEQIQKMLDEIDTWMSDKGYNSLDDFRGKLSRDKIKNPFVYKRAQYVDILMHPEEIIKQYEF
ncbi:MAG: dihydroorotate dehydrogenase-like protein [Bacteroidales bacterium]|nr:dihydroorotate dehydrogenase-like protein [Bacteroidales bacterium]